MIERYSSVFTIDAPVEDDRELADLIAREFYELPPCYFMVPDYAQRREVLQAAFALDIQDVRESGGLVRTVPERTAVALWTHHTGESEPEPALDERLVKAVGDRAERYLEFYQTLHLRQQELLAGRAHDHLWILAVSRASRGQGLGTLLVKDQLARLDSEGVQRPAYLEAATEDLCQYYERLGFERAGKPVLLGESGIAMHPMIREPAHVYV